MNPTSVAKQQRQQEMETIQEEVTRLRELVRSLQDGGSLVQSQEDSIVPNLGLGLPPSKEVLGKIIGSNHHTPASVLVFRCFSDHFDLDSDREPPWTRWAAPVSGGFTVLWWCCYSWRLLSVMPVPDFSSFLFKDVLWFWSLLIISPVYICFCLFLLALNINGDSGRRVRLETLGRSFRLFVGYLHLSPDPRVSSPR